MFLSAWPERKCLGKLTKTTHLSWQRLNWGPCNPNINIKMSKACGGLCTGLVSSLWPFKEQC